MNTHQRNVPATIDPTKLERLAETAVKIGIGLQPGQDLFLTAPVAALPLARLIAREAYKGGAGLVTPIFSDEEMTLARFRLAPDASFDRAPGWLYDGVARAFASNSARLAIVGFDINWNIVAFPTLSWAKRVFPREEDDVAVGKLAEAIFAASRVDSDDPVAAWAEHNSVLGRRRDWLSGKRFHALHYSGPGTDLTIGLAEGHEWQGGASTAKNGVTCNPNIPTEEVFTTPHALRVEGHVVGTKPLSYQGSLIDGIAVRFEAGRIVEAKAAQGEDVLRKVLATDEGARRLGEVALAPDSSPISKSGFMFFNTLFDENAACHIAIGQCYSQCFVGGDKLTSDEIAARGGNRSIIHIDWMIGSGELDIDGLDASGGRTPVFRQGEWAS